MNFQGMGIIDATTSNSADRKRANVMKCLKGRKLVTTITLRQK